MKARPDQIVVEYTAEKKLSINKGPVEIGDLHRGLREIYQDRYDKILYISGAGGLRHGDIVRHLGRRTEQGPGS